MAELTVYPEAGEGGGNVSTDTWLFYSETSGNWNNARNAANASTDAGNDATFGMIQQHDEDVQIELNRMVMTFDTTSIPAGSTVTAAVLSIWRRIGGDNDTFHITSFSPADNATLGVADYSEVGGTSFANVVSTTSTAFLVFTLSTAGEANIAVAGISGFSMRRALDLSGTPSSTQVDTSFSGADVAGTVEDPKLVVTYDLPASAFAHIFQLYP